MTYEEYRTLSGHPVPYTYELRYDDQLLYYFGSEHSYTNAADQQKQSLKDYWQRFLDDTSGARIVLTEGQSLAESDKLSSEQAALLGHGEVGLAAYLAKREDIPIDTADTPPEVLKNELVKPFGTEHVQYYLAIRYLSEQHKRGTPIATVEQHLHQNHQYDQLTRTHKDLFGGEFNTEDTQFFDAIRRPGWRTTRINRIAQEAGYIRNRGVIERIMKELRNNKHVFVIFGATHAVMQEPKLQDQLNT